MEIPQQLQVIRDIERELFALLEQNTQARRRDPVLLAKIDNLQVQYSQFQLREQ